MIKRTDYLNGKNTFHEYYRQFAHIFSSKIKEKHSKEEWKRLLDQDKHLNNVPLDYWNRMSDSAFSQLAHLNFKINGTRSASLSDGICAAKTAVKFYVEEK